MSIEVLELAEYLQSQARECKSLSDALALAMKDTQDNPFDDYSQCGPDLPLFQAADKAVHVLNDMEQALDRLSEVLYTEG